MTFWDSSALVPLLVAEPNSRRMRRVLATDRDVAVWWLSSIECLSALWRRRRDGSLSESALAGAVRDLESLMVGCETVGPAEILREHAGRLLAVHVLRAADALQLAAALLRAGGSTAGVRFVCLDDRLREAAAREGLSVLP